MHCQPLPHPRQQRGAEGHGTEERGHTCVSRKAYKQQPRDWGLQGRAGINGVQPTTNLQPTVCVKAAGTSQMQAG